MSAVGVQLCNNRKVSSLSKEFMKNVRKKGNIMRISDRMNYVYKDQKLTAFA
jgi:hypothetical protein